MTAALADAKNNAVSTAIHHGAKAKTVTGKAIVAVHKYTIKTVWPVVLPALNKR
jgi:hypothetical protein